MHPNQKIPAFSQLIQNTLTIQIVGINTAVIPEGRRIDHQSGILRQMKATANQCGNLLIPGKENVISGVAGFHDFAFTPERSVIILGHHSAVGEEQIGLTGVMNGLLDIPCRQLVHCFRLFFFGFKGTMPGLDHKLSFFLEDPQIIFGVGNDDFCCSQLIQRLFSKKGNCPDLFRYGL